MLKRLTLIYHEHSVKLLKQLLRQRTVITLYDSTRMAVKISVQE